MNPTSLYNLLVSSQQDFDANKIEKFKRLSSAAIEFTLKSGNHGVFRLDPRSKKRYLLIEWDATQDLKPKKEE